VRAAGLRAFPAINVSIRRDRDTAQLGSIGLGLAIDLPVLDRNQGEIAIESATRQQLEDAYLGRVQDARFEVARAHADLLSVRAQLELVKRSVPTLEQLVDNGEALVGSGNVSVIDLYALRLELLDRRLKAEELRQMELELGLALELATGVPWTAPLTGAPAQDNP